MKAMPMMHASMASGPHMGVSVHPMGQGAMGQDYQRAYRQALVGYLMGSQKPSQGQAEQAPAPMAAPPRMY